MGPTRNLARKGAVSAHPRCRVGAFVRPSAEPRALAPAGSDLRPIVTPPVFLYPPRTYSGEIFNCLEAGPGARAPGGDEGETSWMATPISRLPLACPGYPVPAPVGWRS